MINQVVVGVYGGELTPTTIKAKNRNYRNTVTDGVLFDAGINEAVYDANEGDKFVATFSDRYLKRAVKCTVEKLNGTSFITYISVDGKIRNFICEPWLKRVLKNPNLKVGDTFYYTFKKV